MHSKQAVPSTGNPKTVTLTESLSVVLSTCRASFSFSRSLSCCWRITSSSISSFCCCVSWAARFWRRSTIWSQTHTKHYPTCQILSTNGLQDIKPSGHKHTSNFTHQQSSGHQTIWSQTHIKHYPSAVFRTSSHLVTNTCETSIKSLGHQAIWSQTHIKQYPPTLYRTSSHLVTNAHQTVSTNSLQDIKPYGKVLLVHLQETMRHLA